MNILQEADNLINGARQGSYGHPLDNFTDTAKMWSVILGADVTAEQVGLCMIAVKLCRQIHQEKRDNLVDIAGYAGTLELVSEKRAETKEAGTLVSIMDEL